jgi:hypothetical protein
MAVITTGGRITKLTTNDNGVYFAVGKTDELVCIPRVNLNYHGMTAMVAVAMANNIRVEVKTEVDGRTVSLIHMYPDG